MNPGYPNTDTQITDARAAQTLLGIKIQILQASTLSEIEAAFAKVVELRNGGLVITGDPYFHSEQEQIAALATRYAVPTLHYIREFVAAGGLMSYGADYAEAYRLVGGYTGRILKRREAGRPAGAWSRAIRERMTSRWPWNAARLTEFASLGIRHQ